MPDFDLATLPGTAEWMERNARLSAAGLCHKCEKRPASRIWGDALAMTHGGGQPRCGVCVYAPQLRHALARAVLIPKLALLLLIAWVRRA